jgi:hypothetical protein
MRISKNSLPFLPLFFQNQTKRKEQKQRKGFYYPLFCSFYSQEKALVARKKRINPSSRSLRAREKTQEPFCSTERLSLQLSLAHGCGQFFGSQAGSKNSPSAYQDSVGHQHSTFLRI